MFAHEIISGAPVLKEYLISHLKPQFDRDVVLVKSWINKGLIEEIDPEHLFFTIWAATQTYADFSVQMEVLLGKNRLEEADFERAELAVTDFVVRALGAKKIVKNIFRRVFSSILVFLSVLCAFRMCIKMPLFIILTS